jgi:hypothetical protein
LNNQHYAISGEYGPANYWPNQGENQGKPRYRHKKLTYFCRITRSRYLLCSPCSLAAEYTICKPCLGKNSDQASQEGGMRDFLIPTNQPQPDQQQNQQLCQSNSMSWRPRNFSAAHRLPFTLLLALESGGGIIGFMGSRFNRNYRGWGDIFLAVRDTIMTNGSKKSVSTGRTTASGMGAP